MKTLFASQMIAVLFAGSLLAAEPQAVDVIKQAGVTGGVVVHVGCADGELTASLRANDACLVQGLDTDPVNVARARQRFQSLGLAGRVTAALFDGHHLPYADNLVNLLVMTGDQASLPVAEVQRVLCPGGTFVQLQGSAADENKTEVKLVTEVKPWPQKMDQWTHFLHSPNNNAVSQDLLVESPRCLQWTCGPVYGRNHNRLASVSAMVSSNGRLFVIEDQAPAVSMELPAKWRLVARDAFNGVLLWELPIDQWQSTRTGFRSGPVQLPRRLVAIEDRVYVALNDGDPLLCLDAATGQTITTYQGTKGVDEILYQDGTLYLAATESGSEALSRRILAVDADSGKILWNNDRDAASRILPGTLTVSPNRLFFHDGQAVVALDRATGVATWRKPLPSVERRPNWLSPTVLYSDGVLLCGDRAVDYPDKWKQYPELISGMLAHGGLALVTAFAADTGEQLWQTEAAESFHGAVDLFVIDGLVWASRGPARFFFERTRPILAKEMGEDFFIEDVAGRDLRSGEIVKTVDAASAFTLAHHHRCYRDKATERFIIMGRTGIELISLNGGISLRHNWTRGMCQYGVMPANGLLYAPPHPCACYNASKLNGFFAYNSRRRALPEPALANRLTRSSEWNKLKLPPSGSRTPASDDWPTFRADMERSGSVDSTVPENPALAWSCPLSGKLSAPTSADGKVFVAAVDQHTVYALDLSTGKQRWSYIAGGRVDSPPTYWNGRVIFGAADGTIQCLDASDGHLLWQYLAAPQAESIVAWNQLESPWPVAGSLVVRDGSVYALAGRSSYLDGGMRFVRLDAATGDEQVTRQIYSRDPDTGRQNVDDVDDLYLAGLLYDIPSSTGESIFLREARLSLDGSRIDAPRAHLYSVGGFLDDTWWHRYYMLFGTRFKNGPGGGLGRSGGAPYGRLLVCDEQYLYGYGEATPERYHLFQTPKSPAAPSAATSFPAGGQRRTQGKASMPKPAWSVTNFPIMVRAMALAGGEHRPGRLVVAGPPAAAITDAAVLRGQQGGRLAIVDAATGKIQAQRTTGSLPVFDGICLARGGIVICDQAGVVTLFK